MAGFFVELLSNIPTSGGPQLSGLVEYDTAGFMAKNKDEIPMEAATLLASSSCGFIRSIAEAISTKGNGGSAETSRRGAVKSSISRVSVGGQFSNQLRRLRRRIDGTHPHYVRCLKPNDQLQPCNFDPNTVVDQLRCGGIIEAIRVSRAGFPHRYTFEHFSSRFGIIGNVLGDKTRQGPKRAVGKLNFGKSATAKNRKCARGASANPKKSSEILVRNIARWILAERERQKQDDSPGLQRETEVSARSDAMSPRSFWKNQFPHSGDYDAQHKQLDNSEAGIQLGTTKVFLLQDTFDCIERLRGQVLSDSATRLAAVGRMYIARRSYLHILRAYYEARVHQGLEIPLSPPSIAENRSDDSALRSIDVNIERFECVSEEVGERVPDPIEFEWVPSGHGRYVRKAEDDTNDADVEECIPPESDNACRDVCDQLVPPPEGDGSACASVVSLARQRYQQAISPRKALNSDLGMRLKHSKPESPKSSLTLTRGVSVKSTDTLTKPASRDKRAVEGEENPSDRLYRQRMQQKAPRATPTIVRRQFSTPIEPTTSVQSRQGTSFASSGNPEAREVLQRQQSEPHFGAKGANPANYQHFSVPGNRCEVAYQSPHKVRTPSNLGQFKQLDRDPPRKQMQAYSICSHPKPFNPHHRQISAPQLSPSVSTDRCQDESEVNQEPGKPKRISPRSKRRSHRHVARFKQAQHRHQDSDLVDL